MTPRSLKGKNGRYTVGGERLSLLADDRSDKRSLRVKAAAGGAEGEKEGGGASNTLLLGGLFGLWYVFNIFFNIYNKRALNAFPFPVTCTLVHLGVGTLLMVGLWASGFKRAPRLDAEQLRQVLPLAALHALGFTTTNASLGSVNVSFTHTIKAMEPFFTVLLSSAFLGYVPSLPVILSLLPIVGGVVLASVSEVSFTWGGFTSAMASNLCFQSRNVLSKRYMTKASLDSLESSGAPTLDQTDLFGVITASAFLLLLPYWAFVDGGALLGGDAAAVVVARGQSAVQVAIWATLAGLCRFGDVLVSYAILARVIPVTHSVGNCVKRVVVIAASVVVFKTPMSPLNLLGTGLALGGVFLYSAVKSSTQVQEGKAQSRITFSSAAAQLARPVRWAVRGLRKADALAAGLSRFALGGGAREAEAGAGAGAGGDADAGGDRPSEGGEEGGDSTEYFL